MRSVLSVVWVAAILTCWWLWPLATFVVNMVVGVGALVAIWNFFSTWATHQGDGRVWWEMVTRERVE